jgi:Tol biopolymer transport system component
MNSDGTNPKMLTQNSKDYEFSSFSSDGKKILFQSNLEENSDYTFAYKPYIMNIDGTEMKRINNIYGFSPIFSPDNRKIAFTSISGIYTMNLDGSELTLISNESGTADTAVTWSF